MSLRQSGGDFLTVNFIQGFANCYLAVIFGEAGVMWALQTSSIATHRVKTP
jgi:hypothetical protein